MFVVLNHKLVVDMWLSCVLNHRYLYYYCYEGRFVGNYRTKSSVNVMNTNGMFKVDLISHSNAVWLHCNFFVLLLIDLFFFLAYLIFHTQFQVCHPNTSTPNLAIMFNTMNDTVKKSITFCLQWSDTNPLPHAHFSLIIYNWKPVP